jgi:uncharacterized protein YndB with AHSA1/START domain
MRVGGRMTFTFPEAVDAPPIEGEVLELEPPQMFAFTWGPDELRFELEPQGDGCHLRFTHLFDEREKAARDAAGWHVCLGALEDVLAGREPERPHERDMWRRHYDEYSRRGLPTGAHVPD